MGSQLREKSKDSEGIPCPEVTILLKQNPLPGLVSYGTAVNAQEVPEDTRKPGSGDSVDRIHGCHPERELARRAPEASHRVNS